VSVTGFWIIGAVSSSGVEQLRAALPAQSPDSEDLSWWQAMDEAALAEPEERGFGRHCATGAAQRFAEAIEARRPELDQDACMDLLAALTDEDRFVASIRKGDPVAALYYGLGFEASYALPGRSGCFLLTAGDVAAAAPVVDGTLTMDARRRAQVLDRVRAWLEVAGDPGSDFDIDALIGGPRRIVQRALEHGRGALGMVCWY
jgi:hypothetical protein